MKNSFKLILASVFALLGTVSVQAQTSDLAGKIISVGNAVTTLETGQWYVLFNVGTSVFTVEGSGNTLGLSTTSPNGTDAQTNAGYLVQLEAADGEGKY